MPSSSSNSPYARLLAWAAKDVFPHVASVADARKITIAEAVRQHPAVAQHVCGLEFHHDGSGRVDLSLACLSSLCCFDGLLMPPWWKSFVASCDALDEAYALQGGPFAAAQAGSLASSASAPSQSDVVLPDAHWLEFDHDAAGIRLAGVFQPLCARAHEEPFSVPDAGAWAQAWDRLPLGGALGRSMPLLDGVLELVRQQLGWPLWVGLMSGRENLLKLVFRQDGELQERLARFLHTQDLQADAVIKALGSGSDGSHGELRLSLDLDLNTQRLLPSLALEWYPSRSTRETRSWDLLDPLASCLELHPVEVADARACLAALPSGSRPSAAEAALQSLLPLVETAAARAAKLSHYKVTQTATGQWHLKSYVSLTWLADQPARC
jgi:hypothetical protein